MSNIPLCQGALGAGQSDLVTKYTDSQKTPLDKYKLKSAKNVKFKTRRFVRLSKDTMKDLK